jgi:hypothetical protein
MFQIFHAKSHITYITSSLVLLSLRMVEAYFLNVSVSWGIGLSEEYQLGTLHYTSMFLETVVNNWILNNS